MTAPPSTPTQPSVVVSCPHCTHPLLLPGELAGPWGTRVQCPLCREPFLVPAEGLRVARRIERADPAFEADARRSVEERLAYDVVAALVSREGEALVSAAAEGRLFSEWGPHVFAAFDEFRARAGAGADPAVFRRALREQLGVELEVAR